ncbi:MAG: hypothetical protein EOP04_11835 [Proteobacteria bacterium]|nr:MAG: hypothetical protein EOP04_11835 [Pseudomonadota bacterium]
MAKPSEELLAVLYSDYRNYSLRSANIDFVQNELISSSQKIIEFSEEHDAIIQNAGDSLLATFVNANQCLNVVRALYVGLLSAESELKRVSLKHSFVPDRHMIVTCGKAVFCSLGNDSRQELTIAGKPINLAARIDELTKNPRIHHLLISSPSVLFDFATKNEIERNSIGIDFEEVNLAEEAISVRTYHEERRLFIVRYNTKNLSALNDFLKYHLNVMEAA